MKQSKSLSDKEMARIFKALSNPQRLELFRMIYHGFDVQPKKRSKKSSKCCGIERAFTAACECFNLARSTISHHFKELQNAGLITCERRGQSFYCEVNPKALEAVKAFMD
jgi:ArsR family transcriptional regulator, arsenate/arsenite/antimonite-responsive transcriptional repressor